MKAMAGRRILFSISLMLSVIAMRAAVADPAPATAPSTAPSGGEHALILAAAPSSTPSPSEKLLEQKEAYLREKHLGIGNESNPGNANIQWGSAIVSVGTADAAFPKARVLAYETALLAAETEFVKFERERITSQTVAEYINDDSAPNAQLQVDRQNQKEKLQVLQDKLLALAENELDKRMRAAGLNPADYESKPKYEKVVAVRDAIAKKAFLNACGKMAGMRPLQTFEGWDDKGNYAVGVLAVYSPRFGELATVIASGRATHQGNREPGGLVRDQIPSDAGVLMHNFGVRVLADENGDDCIVAFGQWSVIKTPGSERANEIKLQHAMDTARSLADTALADWAAGSVSWNREQDISGIFEKFYRNYPDGKVEDIEAAEFIDKSKDTRIKSANLTISGLSDVRTWRGKHPQSGHEVVGVVRMWSPTSQDRARNLRRPEGVGAAGAEKRPPLKAGTTQGSDFEKMNDW